MNAQAFPEAGIGSFELPAGDVPLIEHFNGTRWTVWPGAAHDGALFGISCTSASFCAAVGNGTGEGAQSLIETFDGRQWQLDSSPNNETMAHNTNRLRSVSCISAGSCVAVGSDLDDLSVHRLEIEQPTIDVLKDSTWSMVPLPSVQLELLSVSCKATSCLAVGSGPAFPNTPQAELFSGDAWSPTVVPPDNFGGVSCPLVHTCWATPLFGNNPTTVYTFNGGWSVPKAQLPDIPMVLGGISCVSAGRCTVVGHSLLTSSSTTERILIGTIDASAATLLSVPKQRTGLDADLVAVSCVSLKACVAVGTVGVLSSPFQRSSKTLTVVER
jgi:hypothetical protein